MGPGGPNRSGEGADTIAAVRNPALLRADAVQPSCGRGDPLPPRRPGRWTGACAVIAVAFLGSCTPLPPTIENAPLPARVTFDPPPVEIPTPAFTSGRWPTSQESLLEFAGELARRPDVYLLDAGRSQLGQSIPMLVFTRAGAPWPSTLAASGRPTVWIMAAQHGNEPASGEGALAMAAELAGPLAPVLENVNVVIVPRANPDGILHESRYAQDGRDLNRDSIRQILAESRQLRRMNLAYAPVLTIDAHEYSPTRPGMRDRGEGRLADIYDLMILGPENPNVDPRVRDLTRELLISRAKRDVTASGLTVHEYYSVRPTAPDEPPHLVLGGTDARIGRNYHGLLNQASVLLETRGIGLGRRHAKRRVFAQWQAMRSMVLTVAEEASRIRATLNEVTLDIIARGRRTGDDDRVAVGIRELPPVLRTHPFLDDGTGWLRKLVVRYTGREQREPKLTRERPLAYVLDPDQFEASSALSDLGLRVYRLVDPVTLEAEVMRVVDNRSDERPYEGVYRQHVEVLIEPRLRAFPPGAYVVPLDQPLANLAVEALEPEGGDSFVCFGVVPARRGRALPIYRVLDAEGFDSMRIAPVPSGMPML